MQLFLEAFHCEIQNGHVIIRILCPWHGQNLKRNYQELLKVIDFLKSTPDILVLTFVSDHFLDDNGKIILSRFLEEMQTHGLEINTNHPIAKTPITLGEKIRTDFITTLGQNTLLAWQQIKDLLHFCLRLIKENWGVRYKFLAQNLYDIGVKALGIIVLISFSIGMVLSYQGINQLQKFGAAIYSIDFLAIGVSREIGVLLTAIVIAGRSASAFAAQIGTMKLNQEIDALHVLGFNSNLVLVLPRIIAMLIALPILVFIANIMAFLGGMLISSLVMNMKPVTYLINLKAALSIHNFLVGFCKSPLFAVVIALIGCFKGFQVEENTTSIGIKTTEAVVLSIFFVIILDAFLSIALSFFGI